MKLLLGEAKKLRGLLMDLHVLNFSLVEGRQFILSLLLSLRLLMLEVR